MNYRKQGYPKDGEILICTVKRILPHSIFVEINEYKDKEGYIHISEIAPGRIRNIRDYVREDKKIVCKVLNIDREKGHIDLSLRRVSEQARLSKLEALKQEEKAEKLLESVAKKLSISLEEVYKKIEAKVLDKYSLFSDFLQDIALNGEQVLKNLSLPSEVSNAIFSIVKEKIKIPEVSIAYSITLSSQEPNGVLIIRSEFLKLESYAKNKDYMIKIKYISAPRYMLTITAKDFRSCEKIGDELSSILVESMRNKGQCIIEKIEK